MPTEPLCLALLLSLSTVAGAQIKHIRIPLGDAVTKALDRQTLTEQGSQPFHLRVMISEPENPNSPYQGSLEEWWASPTQWRREVMTQGAVKQVIVMHEGVKSESDVGDYFPLWLSNFVTASLDPVPDAAAWSVPGSTLEQTVMPNGAASDACVRAKSQIGSGARASDAFYNLCLDGQARIGFYGSPRYSMEFHDYRGFGKKQYPRQMVSNPEPGTKLVGEVVLLEDLAKVHDVGALFHPLSTNDSRLTPVRVDAATMERLSEREAPIAWPPVHSGATHGRLAMYLSVDRDGHVREAWPLNADNAGLEDPARDQVRQWVLKPATDKSGNPVAVDGPLSFAFDTTIGEPLPELSDSEVRALATKTQEPVWPAGALKPGDVVEVQVSVDEQGRLAGAGYGKVPPAAIGAVMNAVRSWTFKPLLRDGKAQYFHGIVRFVVP